MIRGILFCAAVVFAVECLWQTIGNVASRICLQAPDFDISDYREIGRSIPASSDVALLGFDMPSLDSCERTSVIRLNWEISPRVVKSVDFDSVDSWNGAIVSKPLSQDAVEEMRDLGYMLTVMNNSAQLFLRDSSILEHDGKRDDNRQRVPAYLSVVLVAALTILIWLWGRGWRMPRLDQLWISIAVLLVLLVTGGFGALDAPNGLGVYGGKAKLMYLFGGVPSGFWSEAEYAVFQPSYPPLMTLVALLSFVLGGVDDYALQIYVPVVLSLLYLELTHHAPKDTWRRWLGLVLAAVIVVSPEMVWLAHGFYAEPLAMLLIVCGWNSIFEGRNVRGWLCLGLSALARPEGLLVAVISWGFSLATGVVNCREGRDVVRSACLAALPGAVWLLATSALGAHLQDYDFFRIPEYYRFCDARLAVVKALISDFSDNGGVFVVSLGLALAVAASYSRMSEREKRATCLNLKPNLAASMTAVTALFAGVCLISFSTCQDIGWLYEMTLPRYALLSMMPFLAASVHAWGSVRPSNS